MAKAPRMTGKELIKSLMKHSFYVARIKGSHHFLQHNDGRCTSVPVQSKEIIGPGLLNRILKDCELDANDLKN